jgi:pimeloyl-ACP methyl ester carboxylesterase
MSDTDAAHFAYFDAGSTSSVITALDHLDTYLATQGPFDGVIAFSQGAGLAAMHIVRKEYENPVGKPPFKCAILFSPNALYDPRAWVETGEVRPLDPAVDGHPIKIPTFVAWGEQDAWKEECETVSRLCNPEKLFSFVHRGSHEIPGVGLKEEVAPMMKLVKRCIMSSC